MQNIIIKKWIEPYVLLETYKTLYKMRDLTFDGFSKNNAKSQMLKLISENNGKSFGLYMKNVNKFYVFTSETVLDVKNLIESINMTDDDYILCNTVSEPIEDVDLAKAEAAVILSSL